jgi:hypothetical protein
MATELTVVNMPYQSSLDFTANDTAVPAGLEMYFINNGYTILVVNNAAVATNDVTITSVPDDIPGTEDLVVTVAASSIQVFGPFQPLYWNIGGNVYVTFEDNTTITVAALNLTF